MKVPNELKKLPTFKKLEAEGKEYIKKYRVGFYITESSAKFISTKRHCLNYDWDLNYKNITGIAFGSKFIFDSDEDFIIFLLGDQSPIYFNTPGYFSEELQGYDQFIEKLIAKLGFEPIQWGYDTTIIAYPKHLRGKKLYEPWKESINAFLHAIGRKIGVHHEMSGIIRKEFKKELGITT